MYDNIGVNQQQAGYNYPFIVKQNTTDAKMLKSLIDNIKLYITNIDSYEFPLYITSCSYAKVNNVVTVHCNIIDKNNNVILSKEEEGYSFEIQKNGNVIYTIVIFHPNNNITAELYIRNPDYTNYAQYNLNGAQNLHNLQFDVSINPVIIDGRAIIPLPKQLNYITLDKNNITQPSSVNIAFDNSLGLSIYTDTANKASCVFNDDNNPYYSFVDGLSFNNYAALNKYVTQINTLNTQSVSQQTETDLNSLSIEYVIATTASSFLSSENIAAIPSDISNIAETQAGSNLSGASPYNTAYNNIKNGWSFGDNANVSTQPSSTDDGTSIPGDNITINIDYVEPSSTAGIVSINNITPDVYGNIAINFK